MTTRQEKLLKAIIQEFIRSAEAVGSVNLAKRFRLEISPATIRNEMADLMRQGYLQKTHSSSGRIPTNMGFKLFINELLEELDDLEVSISQLIREELFQNRFNLDSLIYTAINQLANQTNNLAIAILQQRIYYSGLTNLVDKPEFHDLVELKKLLNVVENYFLLSDVLNKYKGNERVRVLVGEDTGLGTFSNSALIFSPIHLHGGLEGFIGVVGPNRMDYKKVIPYIDYIAQNINEVITGW